MSTIEQDYLSEDIHPIDIVETLAERHEWDFDRIADDQIAMAIEASWRTYSLTLAWSDYDESLRMICAFDMDPPTERLPELYALMERANDKCWAGAFTLWPEQKLMVYRYALILAGGASASPDQISSMVSTAVSSAERFYPAFQLVCWSDETPEEALHVAMADAFGRA